MKELNSNTIGQKVETWKGFWKDSSIESEIRMWDYYGLRPWILKYTPRYGKILEAGCGLGRYNFLLSKMGIDIEGMDFEKETITRLTKWAAENNFNQTKFIEGDVKNLPYESNSLSGYLSFGVVEHFIEGPQKPILEAYRVLRPGGIAIITTPNYSWSVFFKKSKKNIKSRIKNIIGRKTLKEPFFQYEYKPSKLREFVEGSGLKVTRCSAADILYAFCEFGRFSDRYLKQGTFGYWFSNKFEGSFLRFFGSQSVTISIKVSDLMHCFFCGDLTATPESLDIFDIPICKECQKENIVSEYKRNKKVKFHNKYVINPQIRAQSNEICSYCSTEYLTDSLFENYGYSLNVCNNCIKKTNINLNLSNHHIQPIWRNR